MRPTQWRRSTHVVVGVAVLLLLGAASGDAAVVDVALTLALLSAFASVAYVKYFPSDGADDTYSGRDT